MRELVIKTPPVSTNHMYRGRRFLTKDGKASKSTMALEIAVQGKFALTEDDIALNVLFYFPDNRRRDIDGYLKALLDVMTGIVYKDDSQINELHIFKEVDKENPRTIVQIL